MKKNQQGFGVLGMLTIIAIVGLIAAVGWLVYDRQKKEPTPHASTQTAEEAKQPKAVEPEKLIMLLKNSSVTAATTSLPSGWKTHEACDESSALILPPTKSGVKCGTEDYGFVSIRVTKASESDILANCDGKAAKITEYKTYSWFVSYDCAVVTIDGKQAIQQTTVENENAEFTGAATFTQYSIKLSDNTAITSSFSNPKSDNKPEYTTAYNDFMKTLRFSEIR